METTEIKKEISEAIRLMVEQRIWRNDTEREYCDSLACSQAQEILESLLERL